MKWKFASHKFGAKKFASGRFAGLGADVVAVDGRGLNITAFGNQPRYKLLGNQARYNAVDNQPRYKVSQ